MTEQGRDTQGHNPSGDVFKKEGAVLQAAEEPACGGYKAQAVFSATIAAAAAGGLEGKVVIDLMGRNGMGLRALAAHNPGEIRVFEESVDMMALLKCLLKGDIELKLRDLHAHEILGDRLFWPTVDALTRAQVDFRSSFFFAHGRESPDVGLVMIHANLMEYLNGDTFRNAPTPLGRAHVVMANSWLHWAVNTRSGVHLKEGEKPAVAFRLAFAEAMSVVRSMLRPNGIAVFLTPLDFTWNDRDPERQALLESRTMINHPVARLMMAGISERLRQRGVELPPIQTSRLFKKSAMPRLFRSVGFKLIQTNVWEGTFSSQLNNMTAIDAFFVRYPLWTGKVSSDVVSPTVKHQIATEVAEELRRTVSPDDLHVPIRGYYTLWVVRKQ